MGCGDGGEGGGRGGAGGEGGGRGESGAQPATTRLPAKRNMFGEPEPTPVMASIEAWQRRALSAASGVRPGWYASTCARPPDTCGHAIDVPESVRTSVSELTPAPRTDEPGAKMSTHVP